MQARLFTALFLLLFSFGSFGQDASRTVVSLNGPWKFAADEDESGINSKWDSGLPSDAADVMVPHTWNVMKGLEQYSGLAWYQKKFDVPLSWKNKNIRLRFASVYHDAVIYVNGKKIAEHVNSGYTTFYVNVAGNLKFGEENTLVVSVCNKFSVTNLPYKTSFDWVNDGGIIRDVDIIVSGKPSVRYVHVTPSINFRDTSGRAFVSIRLWEDHLQKAKFNVVISEKRSGKVLYSRDLILTKKGTEFSASVNLNKVRLWRFDDPFLYRIQVTTEARADQQVSQFGFRKVELKGKKLLVNNEEVRLPGIEYMPSSHPDYGSAEPKWVMDSVINMFKDLNATITRFHWQADEHMLDLMDEKGILLQAEIPWWQQPAKLSPELMQTAQKQFTEMIERDYNHPCIFAWGISNEVVNGTDKNQYRSLKAFAWQQDSTRLINVVSNETFKRKQDDESFIGDLPTWNEYIGTWFGKTKTELPEYFATIESFLGDRPLLITENGLCEPRFAGGDLRRTDEMIYHYQEWAKRDYIAGCIYFCLNDYRTHMGEDGAGRFKARIHGLTDLYFKKKPSYYVFKQLASPIEIVNVKKVNASKLTVLLLNKNTLPSYSLMHYNIVWRDLQGKMQKKEIPLMSPGTKTDVELDNIEERFAFEILSPTGSTVTSYPLINK